MTFDEWWQSFSYRPDRTDRWIAEQAWNAAATQEQEHSMMAGSQNSALRLQVKDAEERASRWAKIADQRAIEVADLKVALAKASPTATVIRTK